MTLAIQINQQGTNTTPSRDTRIRYLGHRTGFAHPVVNSSISRKLPTRSTPPTTKMCPATPARRVTSQRTQQHIHVQMYASSMACSDLPNPLDESKTELSPRSRLSLGSCLGLGCHRWGCLGDPQALLPLQCSLGCPDYTRLFVLAAST